MTSMKFWKIITVSLSILFPFSTGNSCIFAPPAPPFALMDPNLSGTQPYSKFWYDPFNFYNNLVEVDSSYDYGKDQWEENIIKDWAAYSHNKFSASTLKKSLFTKSENYKKDSLFEWLKQKQAGQEYFMLMKKVPEVLSSKSDWEDYAWSYSEKQNQYGITLNKQFVEELIQSAENILKKNPEDFIKRRCAYQLLKVYHYTNNSDQAKQVFTKYFNDNNKDWFYYSAMFYYALAFEDNEESRLLLECFRNNQDKKTRIISIFPMHNLSQLLATDLTLQQKNDLLCIEALRSPENKTLSNLSTIVETEPQHPFVNVLLSREINKLEDHGLNYNHIFDAENYNSYLLPQYKNTKLIHSYQQKIKENAFNFRKIINLLEQKGAAQSQKYFMLLHTYIAILEGNKSEGQALLEKLKTQPLSQKENIAIEAIEIIGQSLDENLYTEKFEQRFVSILLRTNRLAASHNFYKRMAYNLIAHLNWTYLINNHYENGALLSLSLTDIDPNTIHSANNAENYDSMLSIINYKNTEHTAKFIRTLLFTNFSNLDKLRLTHNEVTQQLYWTKFNWLMRRDRTAEALEYYNLMHNNLAYLRPYMANNPFYINFEGTYSYSDQEPAQIELSALLKKIQNLKSQLSVAKDDEFSKIAFILGNAFHSFSNEGNNYLLSYTYSSNYLYKQNYGQDFHDYYTSALADKYYQMAWEKCTNPDLGAMISIQQGACKVKNDIYYSDSSSSNLQYYKTRPTPYDTRFKNRFGSLNVLNKYTSNCDNIRNYYKNFYYLVEK